MRLTQKETKMKKLNKKGFTLAELLIVVAIIAVLVAIAIPVFSSQLEKSREAVDAANIRAAYAEISADALTGDLPDDMSKYNVELKQQTEKWGTKFDFPANLEEATDAVEPTKGTTVTFTYDAADGGKVKASIKLK